jgi:acetolactate synthase-1/2/3 large subunit
MSSMTGSELLCRTLEQLGVEVVFGLPGTLNVPIYEALRRSSVRAVTASDELAAAFMANGYYRASGKVGVVTVIPGPGFTYALTGLAEAQHDSAAVLLITLKKSDEAARKFAFQVIDQASLAAPLVKRIIEIDRIELLVPRVREAYSAALQGEPGPVMVEIHSDLMNQVHEYLSADRSPDSGTFNVPNAAGIDEAAKLLSESRRPIIYVGQGAAESWRQVIGLAEKFNCPVFSTCSGRGIVPEDHPLSFGYDFSYGVGKTAAEIISEADLVLAIGCKFTHNGSGGFRLHLPADKLIQVDTSSEVIGANYPVKLGIVSNAILFLEALLKHPQVAPIQGPKWSKAELSAKQAQLRSEQLKTVPQEPEVSGLDRKDLLTFFESLRKALPAESCLVTDSGQHQLLTRTYFRVLTPRGLIVPADFQSMGFGLPAAIGARLARPDRPVVALIGDGALAMTATELLTAVRENIDLTVIVFNDGHFGLIRLQQESQTGHSYGVKLFNPDISALASTMGVSYLRLAGDPKETLASVIGEPGVKLVEAVLKDSPSIRRLQVSSAAREMTRRAIGPKPARWLKRLVRRSR